MPGTTERVRKAWWEGVNSMLK